MSAQNPHPQAKEAFKEGLESVLRQWTALELAVVNEWGGSNSSIKAQQLLDELLHQFQSARQTVYVDVSLTSTECFFMELFSPTRCFCYPSFAGSVGLLGRIHGTQLQHNL